MMFHLGVGDDVLKLTWRNWCWL